jgi:ADP-dependent NAD(P)H-hydrate dehydratase
VKSKSARKSATQSSAARTRPVEATRITASLLRRWPLPKSDPKLGKESRGDVLVVGGSAQIPGAAMLAGLCALRAGAGRLQIATSRSVAREVAVAMLEARVIGLPETRRGELAAGSYRTLASEIAACDALLLGPGMRDGRAAIELARQWVRTRARCALIMDAEALRVFDTGKPLGSRLAAEVIITPHAGEMARLWGCDREAVLENPLRVAREAASALRVVVVMKGPRTFIVAPDGQAFYNLEGNSGLGTSGSGDALSGIIAALAARGATALQAASWGVHLHAVAGDVLAQRIGPLGFLARELPAEIPALLARLER